MNKTFKLLPALLLAALAFNTPVQAKGEAGVFDYWVLSLSWSPEFCNSHGSDPQCMRSFNFVLHGMWPEYEQDGYPRYCSDVDRVEKDLVMRMTAIMPSAPLIQHEWQEHGSCSGMDVNNYFLTAERIHRSLVIPAIYQDVSDDLKTTIEEVKNTFAESNSQLAPTDIALQCSGRYLQEVRICYDKDFKPRDCGEDVKDHCGKKVILRSTR